MAVSFISYIHKKNTQDSMKEAPLLILVFISANYNNSLFNPKEDLSKFQGQKNDNNSFKILSEEERVKATEFSFHSLLYTILKW